MIYQHCKRPWNLKQILQAMFFLLPFCATIAAGLLSYTLFSKTMTEQIAGSRVDVLEQISERTSAIFNSIDTISNFYYYNLPLEDIFTNNLPADSSQDSVYSSFETLDAMIRETVEATGLSFYYVVTTEDGFSYSSKGDSEEYTIENYQKKIWYPDITGAKGDPVVISTYKDFSSSPQYVFSIASSVADPLDHSSTGIFTFNVSEQSLSDTYDNFIDTNMIYIVDKNGTIISHSNKDMLSINFYNMKRFEEMFENADFKIIQKNGDSFLFSKFYNENLGWWIVEEIPLKDVLAPLNPLKYMTVGICVFVFILSVLLSKYLSVKIVVPLSTLCHELEEFGRSETNKVFHASGYQEIESICDECNYMSQRITALMDDIKEKENAKRHAELEFLQSQMNPHFIYNTLFSIKCLVDMGNREKALGIIDSFTAILKNTLSYKTKFITIRDEISFLENYITLQKYRYGDIFDFECHCPPLLLEQKILRMLIQPLIENSIFHGFSGITCRGKITLSFTPAGRNLEIRIQDNGHGFDPAQLQQNANSCITVNTSKSCHSNFVGIQNISERIHLHFGNAYGLKISSQAGHGTLITILIPLT